jgi:hypothetical protein
MEGEGKARGRPLDGTTFLKMLFQIQPEEIKVGHKRYFFKKWMAFILLIFLLAPGCGGGGGGESTSMNPSGGESTSSPPSEIGVISGNAVKGPVSGGTVIAFSMNGDGTKGGQIGSAQTDGQGHFSLSVGNHSGPLMLQMSGGNYMDEATGSQMPVDPNDVMTCVISYMSPNSTVSGIQITPLTSMAQSMAQNMSGGMNQTNITLANSSVGKFFAINDILTTHPMNPNVNGSGVSSIQDMRNYGMSIAAMSQYAKTIGMPHSSGIVTAMMNDSSDGRMDGMMTGQGGMMGNQQIQMGGGMMNGTVMPADAGTRGLADAMAQFINSPMNRSGLTMQDMQNLMDTLRVSNGQIQ